MTRREYKLASIEKFFLGQNRASRCIDSSARNMDDFLWEITCNACGKKDIRRGKHITGIINKNSRCQCVSRKEHSRRMKKITSQMVKDACERRGVKYLFHNEKKVSFICKEGCAHNAFRNDFISKDKLFVCQESKRLKKEEVEQRLKEVGFTLLGDYVNQRKDILVRCDSCGYDFHRPFVRLENSPSCARCGRARSVHERWLGDFIEEEFGCQFEVQFNNRELLKPWELDLVLIRFDEIVGAIEWNGIYWHREEKTVERDRLKKEELTKMGIPLLQIEDDSIKHSKDFVREKFTKEVLPFIEEEVQVNFVDDWL